MAVESISYNVRFIDFRQTVQHARVRYPEIDNNDTKYKLIHINNMLLFVRLKATVVTLLI